MGLGGKGEVKLRARTIRGGSLRHGDDPGRIMIHVDMVFIHDGISRATKAGTERVSTLYHKIFHHAVEDGSVIEACSGQVDEVVGGDGHEVFAQFYPEVAGNGVEVSQGLGLGGKRQRQEDKEEIFLHRNKDFYTR
jgi:hypothetical protein